MLDLIYAQNDYIIKKIEEISSMGTMSKDSLNKDIREMVELNNEIRESLKNRELNDKQYGVLKYYISNPYANDKQLSINAKVSYSSVSQWKHKHKVFRDFYDRIKYLK